MMSSVLSMIALVKKNTESSPMNRSSHHLLKSLRVKAHSDLKIPGVNQLKTILLTQITITSALFLNDNRQQLMSNQVLK